MFNFQCKSAKLSHELENVGNREIQYILLDCLNVGKKAALKIIVKNTTIIGGIDTRSSNFV